MPPIALPLETPQEALLRDLLRPAVVVNLAVPSFRRDVFCLGTPLERGERPHGGEPNIRTTQINTATSTGSTAMIAAYHEPWLDSASNLIIEDIQRYRRPSNLIPAQNWRSTGLDQQALPHRNS